MQNSRCLVLAGTTEARLLADQLFEAGIKVVSSFAGVTRQPILPRGEIRVGGFGGVDGLMDYLKAAKISHVIDATHPFAAQMASNAHAAATRLGLPLLRLERPACLAQNGDKWISVIDMNDAVAAVPIGAKLMVTTGRKNLEPLFQRADLSGLVRTIEAPDDPLPVGWQLLLDRPPYALEHEQSLLQKHGITFILCKNAGGVATVAKLTAARILGISVAMIKRPLKPSCSTVATVSAALQWTKTMGLESSAAQVSLLDSTKG